MEPKIGQFEHTVVDGYADAKAKDAANESLEKHYEDTPPTWDNPVRAQTKEFWKNYNENDREFGTREAVREGTTVADAERQAKSGFYTEVSGDALARMKAGKPAKYIGYNNNGN